MPETETPRPRLAAVAGPLAGAVFELGEGELVLGRQAGCGVQIRDLEVSRRHCTLTRNPGAAGRFLVRDLGSRHGTFVNGLPLAERAERELLPGDAIGLGGSLFVFTAGAEDGERTAVQLDSGDWTAATSVRLAPRESAYLRPGTPGLPAPSASPEAGTRLLRDLSLLVRIGAVLQALPAVEPLCRRLLGLLFEAVPAGRAALLLLDREDGEPAAAYTLDRKSGSGRPFEVSRTVVQKVLGEKTGLLANDLLRSSGLGEAASVRAARLRSLLAVPVLHLDRALGLLYLDAPEAGETARFDRGHLELATAVAGLAAPALANARRMERLEAERRALATGLESAGRGLVGESPRLAAVRAFLARVAPTDSTVLLRGESGTGKELAARAIHAGSPRAGGPFLAINCATLSETLLESELFGHEKGAFTGAVAQKTGKFEAADGGTLFLDEVGEIPVHLQARLLRALEEREIVRVGSTRTIPVDVRLLAATHRDLEKGIAAGTFRADLFYRLNVLSLTLPPLRDRREDIPLLARSFVARLGPRLGRPAADFTPEALDCLLRYAWPGNVRELGNAVERALVLGEGDWLRPEDLPEAVIEAGGRSGRSEGPVAPYHEAVLRLKEDLVLQAVGEAGGNVTRAADLLGIHPNYLHRLIRNLGLRPRLALLPEP